jgi:D-amino-acid dehydrogenase
MRRVVLGVGDIRLASAYLLRQASHQITVRERGSGPAGGASQGNAGGRCPGFSGPWVSPTVLRKAVGWLLRKNASLGFGRGIQGADLPCLVHLLRK